MPADTKFEFDEEAQPNAEKGIEDIPVPSNGDEEQNDVEKANPDLYPKGWKEMDGMFMGPDSPSGKGSVSVPQGEMNGENDGMSLEPESDEVEQIANDKEEVGELIPGGKGDGKSPLEFTPDQILKGMKVEMEHTDDPMFALEITMDHLTEDPEYYGTDEEDPDKMAQTNASADVEGGEGDDKEMTDMLLGFKPHNVGDEIEGEEEIEEPEEESPEHEAGETPEEEKIETEEEPEEEKKELNEGQIKIARETLSYRRVPTGMTKKEAVQILIKHNIR